MIPARLPFGLIDGYVGRAVLAALTLVLLAVVAMFSLIDLIQQLDDVGKGSYGFADALRYEMLMLPRRALDLLPFAALTGTTIALAVLAHTGELVALRACGASPARVALAVVKTGLALVLLAAVAEELVASPLQQQAVQGRALDLAAGEVQKRQERFWIHSGSQLVSIGRVRHGNVPEDIDIVELGDDQRLRAFIHAHQADISDPGLWVLEDVTLKRLGAGPTVTERLPTMRWSPYLTLKQVQLVQLPAHVMAPSQLYGYIGYLGAGGQSTERYELVLWQKLTLPLTTGAMILLAVPAGFAPPRSTRSGARVVLAIAFGLMFQIVSQLVASAGLAFELSAPLVTLGPLALLLVAAWATLRRVGALAAGARVPPRR
jgi:lipopolysaccharide export system permease protein